MRKYTIARILLVINIWARCTMFFRKSKNHKHFWVEKGVAEHGTIEERPFAIRTGMMQAYICADCGLEKKEPKSGFATTWIAMDTHWKDKDLKKNEMHGE